MEATKELLTIDQLMRRLPASVPKKHRQKVWSAHVFAREAHKDRRRESGELFVQHDLAVADTINQIGVDILSTSSGMLHDTLLDHTGKSLQELERSFGPEVSKLVAGLDKLDPYIQRSQDVDGRRAEIIRRAILTILDDDLRIVIIRMADALQDLRHAAELSPERQRRVAEEARNIYGPLANQLGIWQIKWQLEDLSFRFLEPEQYQEITNLLSERRVERDESINQAIMQLRRELEKVGVRATVTGRPKHIYSIYRKMDRKDVSFDEIYDVRAVRVIVEGGEAQQCYQVLGVVHNLWLPISQEFDDYIARPKSNGYQSLHTAVIDTQGRVLEVQIRTRAMHEEAERGIAAHWAYKEGGRYDQLYNRRIQMLRDMLKGDDSAEHEDDDEVVVSLEELEDRIFVFSPKGDPIDLPLGATPIDFAYHIHTEVGHRCRGAKVNGKMVKLDQKLKNGDRVEIITAKRGGPNRDWLNESLGYAAGARTRSRIRRWFRKQEREQNIIQGEEVVEREIRRLGLADSIKIADVAQALKENDVDDFLAKVGFGDIQSSQIGGAISVVYQRLRPDDELRPLFTPQRRASGLTVKGVSGLHTRLAQCCNPAPPEGIVGYITRGRGITVHRNDCQTVLSIDEPERIIDVSWGYEEETYPIPIVIRGFDRPGLMNDITNLFKGRGINLTRTKSTTENGASTIHLVAEIANLSELDWLLRKLEKLPNVLDVVRQRW